MAGQGDPNKVNKKKNTTKASKPSGSTSAGEFRMAEAKADSGPYNVNTNLGSDITKPTGGDIGSNVSPAMMQLLSGLFGGGGGGGGGSSTANARINARAKKSIAANQLAFDKQKYLDNLAFEQQKYNDEVGSDALKLSNQRTGLDKYIAGLQSIIDAGPTGYGKKQEDLITQLGTIYGDAKNTIAGSQSDLEKSLSGMTNPFAGYQAQVAPTFDTTNLRNLLEGSQVGTDPLQRLAALQQNENAGQTAAFQNLMNNLGRVYQGSMSDRLATTRQGSAAATNQAALNNAGLISQLRGQQTDELDKLRQLILQGNLQRAQLG